MKHLFILLLLASLFSSCKKDADPDPGSIERDPNFEKKLRSSSHQAGYDLQLAYNANGSLKTISDNSNTETVFTYNPVFTLIYKYPGTVYELKNTIKNQMGRISKVELWKNGVLTDKNEYNYNSGGYLVKMKSVKVASGVTFITDYNYENGNLISSKSFSDGQMRYSHQFTYYTDKVNKFNVDIYDQFEHKFMAGAFFGKLNRNLLKSWSFTSFPSNTTHYNEYSYSLDAEGYPVKLTHVDDGYTSNTNFVFQ